MEDENEAASEYASHGFTAIQLSALAGHMILANTLDSGLVIHYEVQDPQEWYISMAIRKGGKATIGMYSEKTPQVFMMEIIADADNMTFNRKKHIFKMLDQDMAEDCWDDILDQLGSWANGEIDEIIIGEKPICDEED